MRRINDATNKAIEIEALFMTKVPSQ
jgi:hypothetical protein